MAGKPEVSTPPLLQASIRKQLSRTFALDVSLAVPAGITIIFGPSGAGKTTLLDCISGLKKPDSGHIALGGEVLFSTDGTNVDIHKRRIGYVFQNLALFPHLTVDENVGYGLPSLTAPEKRRHVEQILETFHVAHLLKSKPGEISGGERQRVALARSLVTDPALLMLDEPLAALDRKTKMKIVEDLRSWNEKRQVPILYVTHSYAEAFSLGERVILMSSGRIVATGSPQDVLGPEAAEWE